MSHRSGGSLLWLGVTRAGFGAICLVVAMTGLAWPQAAPQTQAQPAPPVPAPSLQSAPETPPAPTEPPRKENPGLINELEKLFSGSSSILPDMKGSGQAIEDFNTRAWDATKNAAGAISRLAKSPGVSGRMACPVAANGAPDCKAAADKLCQSKGFKEGRSVDMDSAETCSAKTLIPGRERQPGDCRTDNYVTRAICQ